MTDFVDSVEYPDLFSVSRYGEIYSKRTRRILKQATSKTGYKEISSRVGGREGKCILLRVHREVALAFVPNPKNKPYVNHINGDKTDNNASNLEWVTASENTRHACDTGLLVPLSGENHACSKLTESDVRFIKEHYTPNSRTMGARALAKRFGVSHCNINRIIHGKAWTQVK